MDLNILIIIISAIIVSFVNIMVKFKYLEEKEKNR